MCTPPNEMTPILLLLLAKWDLSRAKEAYPIQLARFVSRYRASVSPQSFSLDYCDSSLFKRPVSLANQHPKQNLQLYGINGEDVSCPHLFSTRRGSRAAKKSRARESSAFDTPSAETDNTRSCHQFCHRGHRIHIGGGRDGRDLRAGERGREGDPQVAAFVTQRRLKTDFQVPRCRSTAAAAAAAAPVAATAAAALLPAAADCHHQANARWKQTNGRRTDSDEGRRRRRRRSNVV